MVGVMVMGLKYVSRLMVECGHVIRMLKIWQKLVLPESYKEIISLLQIDLNTLNKNYKCLLQKTLGLENENEIIKLILSLKKEKAKSKCEVLSTSLTRRLLQF